MDLDILQWSKSDRERQISLSHVGPKKIIQINLFIKQKLIQRHRKQTYGYQKRIGVGGGR